MLKKPGITLREKRRLEEVERQAQEELTDDEPLSPSPRRDRDLANSRAYITNSVIYSKPKKKKVRPLSENLASHSVSDSELFDNGVTDRRTNRRYSERSYGTNKSSNSNSLRDKYISPTRDRGSVDGYRGTTSQQSWSHGYEPNGRVSTDLERYSMTDQYRDAEDGYQNGDEDQGYGGYTNEVSIIIDVHCNCISLDLSISVV